MVSVSVARSLVIFNKIPRYKELPKIERPVVSNQFIKKSAIGQYFTSLHCIVCNCVTSDSICADCSVKQDNATLKISSLVHIAEQKCKNLNQVWYLECP